MFDAAATVEERSLTKLETKDDKKVVVVDVDVMRCVCVLEESSTVNDNGPVIVVTVSFVDVVDIGSSGQAESLMKQVQPVGIVHCCKKNKLSHNVRTDVVSCDAPSNLCHLIG
jgi:hypothetical protein